MPPAERSSAVLKRDDPRVTAVARQLEITMIQRVWVEDDVLYIQDPYDTYEIAHYKETDTHPALTGERVYTLPHSGSNAPAPTFIGGSGHTPGAASQPPPDPEPPTNAKPAVSDPAERSLARNRQAERSSAGLDDFTAIPGVGSVTAQKLHDKGLFTYDDLRTWIELVEEDDSISDRTLSQIKAWLEEHLL